MATSTLDRRRINAPETVSLHRMPGRRAPTNARTTVEAQSRAHPLFVQTGLVHHASGSAYYESQTAKVACAVYGPRQSQGTSGMAGATGGGGSAAGGSSSSSAVAGRSYTHEAELNVDVRFASFATQRRKRAGKETESASVASAVRLALLPSIRLDALPKATIDVFITILETDAGRGSDGGENEETCATAAATAASCALADAGIELYALVVGTHAVLLEREAAEEEKGEAPALVVDSTVEEARRARGCVMLYSMPALGTITSVEQSGQITLNEMEKTMTVLQAASAGIHLTAAKAIQRGFADRQAKQAEGSEE